MNYLNSLFLFSSYKLSPFIYTMKLSILVLFTSLTLLVESKSLDLSEYNLCTVQGDETDCNFACQEMVQGKGNCIFDKCYCTEKTEVGQCEEDDHEACDALCQDMSSTLIGFCMDGQCNCIT